MQCMRAVLLPARAACSRHILCREVLSRLRWTPLLHAGLVHFRPSSDMAHHTDRLIWVDLEMTGLDLEKCHIMEMACVITDGQLNVIAEGPDVIIRQPDDVLNDMDTWCKHHHGKSGLTEACRNSLVSLQEAEITMLDFVKQHTQPDSCPLAGNTVHEDKRFLKKYMPTFAKHLHYRIVDVTTVKELCRRWYPEEFKRAEKKTWRHRAMSDIHESIAELQYYRKTIFK